MELRILYEDSDITVLEKPAGVFSEETGVPALLRQRWGDPDAYVGVVHRLDTGVSGVMVYARTPAAAAALSRQVQDKRFAKEYRAVLAGGADDCLACEGVLVDLLFKDSRKGRVFPVSRARKGVKEATLSYRLVGTAAFDSPDGEQTASLAEIHLQTGRTHQIRVQFASRKHPLLGDGKYGSRVKCPIALQSCRICFAHPTTRRAMEFSLPLPCAWPFGLFSAEDGQAEPPQYAKTAEAAGAGIAKASAAAEAPAAPETAAVRTPAALPAPVLNTKRLLLRLADPCFAAALNDFNCRNRDFMREFEPLREASFFTVDEQARLLAEEAENAAHRTGFRFYLFDKSAPERIIGCVGLNNVVWGAFCSCFVGCRMDGTCVNKGYMTEALCAVARYAFDTLGLHRLEGNIMPRNGRSLHMAEKCGFTNEGLARRYLQINGVWEDHIHMVRLAEDPFDDPFIARQTNSAQPRTKIAAICKPT